MESRRRFVCRAETLALGLVPGLVPALASCARFNVVAAEVAGQRLVVDAAELGSARFALIEAPGQTFPLYLYRHDDGAFTAVLTRCMHRGCQVEAADGHLVCPCHGSEYDNAGGILKGPTELPLIRYPVEVEAGRLYIGLVPLEGPPA